MAEQELNPEVQDAQQKEKQNADTLKQDILKNILTSMKVNRAIGMSDQTIEDVLRQIQNELPNLQQEIQTAHRDDNPGFVDDELNKKILTEVFQHPEDYPNPESFLTMMFGRPPEDLSERPYFGIATFVTHSDKDNEYYLNGLSLNQNGIADFKNPVRYPVTKNILNLNYIERDTVANRIQSHFEGKDCDIMYRVSDPEIRVFLEKEEPRIAAAISGKEGVHYIDQYDAYYKAIANALLDHEPKFGIERIASSMEQLALICHPENFHCRENPEKDWPYKLNRDIEYVTKMLSSFLQERGASQKDKDILVAYSKAFHDGEAKEAFCKVSNGAEQYNGLSLRVQANTFPELPLDTPCYTFQSYEAREDRPVYQQHVFLDGKPKDDYSAYSKDWHQRGDCYSARQAAFLHCLNDKDLAARIDWKNPQVCATAASVLAIWKNMEKIKNVKIGPYVPHEHYSVLEQCFVAPQKNTYPDKEDIQVLNPQASAEIQCKMPCYRHAREVVHYDAYSNPAVDGVSKINDKDANVSITFSGKLEDIKEMDEGRISTQYEEKERNMNLLIPTRWEYPEGLSKADGTSVDKSELQDAADIKEYASQDKNEYLAITQIGEDFDFSAEAKPLTEKMNELGEKFGQTRDSLLKGTEHETNTVFLQIPREGELPVNVAYVPESKLDTFLYKTHRKVEKAIRKNKSFKKYNEAHREATKLNDCEIPF